MNQDNPKHSPDPEQAALKWLIRLTSGETTTQEKQDFDAWLHTNPAHRQAFENIQRLWDDTTRLNYNPKTSHVNVPDQPKIIQKTRSRKPRGTWSKPVLVGIATMAACLVLVWWSGWHWWMISDYTTSEHRQTVSLSDGLQITLDAQTALDINSFPGKTLVTLRAGAAWFKVFAQPEGHVVRVLTDQISVTSLGTEFLVEQHSSYQYVAVTEHAVELTSRASPSLSTQLQEGYGISLDAASTLPWEKTVVDPAIIGAWRNGRLIFENAPLQHVIQRLDDYYPGLLLITDNTLLHQKVSGVFDIDHPERALASLQLAFPLTIRRVSTYLVLISQA